MSENREGMFVIATSSSRWNGSHPDTGKTTTESLEGDTLEIIQDLGYGLDLRHLKTGYIYRGMPTIGNDIQLHPLLNG